MLFEKMKWTREPKAFKFVKDKIEVITAPHTDLWQRTYYHFRNDNAPVFQLETYGVRVEGSRRSAARLKYIHFSSFVI